MFQYLHRRLTDGIEGVVDWIVFEIERLFKRSSIQLFYSVELESESK